jgi:hypothetical protein
LSEVLDGLRRVGWGFLVVVALTGVRYLIRAAAWTLCVEPPAKLPLGDAVLAGVAGDALGNLTPLGLFASEPTKALWARRHVPLIAVSAAITLENLFYSLSVLAVFFLGTVVVLFGFTVPEELRVGIVVVLLASTAVTGAVVWIIQARLRLASRVLAWLDGRGVAPRYLPAAVEAVRSLETLIHQFAERNRRRLLPIALLEAAFHVVAIAEVWVILALLGLGATHWMTVFALEYVNRVITVVFKFMPLRLGVDEAGTGLATRLVGLGSAPGVTMAVVRKMRALAWALAGLVFLSRRSLRGQSS